MPALEQHPVMAEKRILDGSEGLPPVSKSRRRKGKGKQPSLQTTSVPLIPDASCTLSSDSHFDLQQAARLSMTSERAPVLRRSTVSDAGQLSKSFQDVAQQLEPALDAVDRSPASCSKFADFTTAGGDAAATDRSSCAGTRREVQLSPLGEYWQQQPSSRPHSPAKAAAASSQQLHHHHHHPLHTHGAALHSGGGGTAAHPSVRPGSALQSMVSIDLSTPAPPPSLWGFFHAEATPHEKYPTADVLWRQTERDRVYNFLLYVPYQLERIMIFGTLLCFYSFLGALTVLPLRCLRTLWQLASSLLLLLPGVRGRQQQQQPAAAVGSRGRAVPSGAQLYDLLCVLLLLGAAGMLSLIKPGMIYYWMKDITSEFLKIQLIFTALEILDKILSNFGVDVLEALSSTCTLFTRRSIGLGPLASDLLVAFLLITAHGSVLMCQAMVFAVSMNSKANALLALMIATNFVELKGQVYKRTDTNKLWTLACQDIVERFELLLVLCFVVVEDISNGGCWMPTAGTLLVCGRIFFWEIIIDIAKHAVLGKFNDIRPGIYREYMRDLCGDSLDHHSHNMHKLVGFCPMGPAALCLRMFHTLFTLKGDGTPQWHLRAAFLLVAWLAACALQVVLGFSLKWLAYLYVQHAAGLAGGRSVPRAINVTPAGAKLAPAAAAAARPSIGLAPAAAGAAAANASAAAAAAAGKGGNSSGLGTTTAAKGGAAGSTGDAGGLFSLEQAAGGPFSVQRASAHAACGVAVKHSHSDEGQCRRSSSSSSSSNRAATASASGHSVPSRDAAVVGAARAMQDSLPAAGAAATVPGAAASALKNRSRTGGVATSSSSSSSSTADSSVAPRAVEPSAGARAAADDLSLGFGSSYHAPSAAGLSHRTCSKAQSSADVVGRSSMLPALAAAQE